MPGANSTTMDTPPYGRMIGTADLLAAYANTNQCHTDKLPKYHDFTPEYLFEQLSEQAAVFELSVQKDKEVWMKYFTRLAPICTLFDFLYKDGPQNEKLCFRIAHLELPGKAIDMDERKVLIKQVKEWHYERCEQLGIESEHTCPRDHALHDFIQHDINKYNKGMVMNIDFEVSTALPLKLYLDPSVLEKPLDSLDMLDFPNFPAHAREDLKWLDSIGFENIISVGVHLVKKQVKLYYIWKDTPQHPWNEEFLNKMMQRFGVIQDDDRTKKILDQFHRKSNIYGALNVNFFWDKDSKISSSVYIIDPSFEDSYLGKDLTIFKNDMKPQGQLGAIGFKFVDGKPITMGADKLFPDPDMKKLFDDIYA